MTSLHLSWDVGFKKPRPHQDQHYSTIITLLKSSELSSINPRVYFVSEWRTSKQWILSPLAIGKSKLTRARRFGFGIPNGASKLAMKSDIWWKLINWVAWGSNLRKNEFSIKSRVSKSHSIFVVQVLRLKIKYFRYHSYNRA